MNDVVEFLVNDIKLKNDDTVVIAVSGGPDSMALLTIISKLRNKLDLKIICAHVHHNVRRESDNEAIFVKEFCEKNDILFEMMKIENYNDNNFHRQAREKRYQFFETLIRKYHAKYLFTAHHGDDLIETILMRMVRGSTLRGYAGFLTVVERENYKIVRPLIHHTKEEIIHYLEQNNITWVEDQSNLKDVYTRNRFRKYIVPQLKSEERNVHDKFYKFSNLLIQYSDYVNQQTQNAMFHVYKNHTLDLLEFRLLEQLIQRNLLAMILEQYYKDNIAVISDKHITMIKDMINSEKSNLTIQLPNQLIVRKSYQFVHFDYHVEKLNAYHYKLEDDLLLPNGKKIIQVEQEDSNSNNVCRLDTNDIHLPLYVRTRKSGDSMEVKGLNGHKKIKDIFIDEKIPIEERNEWPIVIDSLGNIVWLPGIKKSKFDKSKKEKYDIILKYE